MSQENAPPQFSFFQGSVKKAMKFAGAGSSDLWKVPPSQLRRQDGFNVRVPGESYSARVRELADSIKANGFYVDKALTGYVAREGEDDVIIITDGHTRLAAVELAISEGCEIETVPVITKPSGTSMEDLTVALVTSNNGAPLKPFEVALVCKRLVNYGMAEETIANRLGYTLTHVQSLLLLMSAPASIRDMVSSEKISASLAIETLRKEGPKAAEALLAASAHAESSGAARVTAKQMKGAKEARGVQVFKLRKPDISRSVSWLREQELHNDPGVLRFLSFLAGIKSNEGDEQASAKELIESMLTRDTKKDRKSASAKGRVKRVQGELELP